MRWTRHALWMITIGTLFACSAEQPMGPSSGDGRSLESATEVDITVGSLDVSVLYNGAPPSATGADCFFGHRLGTKYLGIFCDGRTSDDLAPGDYPLRLFYNDGSGAPLVPVPTVTIVGGQTTTHAFDVSSVVGVVEGKVTVNGGVPPSGYGVCGSTDGSICGELGPDGSFKLLLPAGSGTGFVWGSNCQCHEVATLEFDVVAGTTTDIGTIDVGLGQLETLVLYNGAPPSVTGADCFFGHRLGTKYLGIFCDGRTSDDLAPGDYPLRLFYNDGSGTPLVPVPTVTIVGGQTTTHTFDVSGVVGVVEGKVTVNGGVPPPGYGVCGSTDGSICGELGPDGSFKLLLPAGSGTGFVWGSNCQCHEVATLEFDVVAGTTTDIGTIEVGLGQLETLVLYNGAPPSVTGADCFFGHRLGTKYLGIFCDGRTSDDLAPGDYPLRLFYNDGSGTPLVPVPTVTIVAGQTTTHTFDVSGVVGVVEGKVTVNGGVPPPGYGVCGSTDGSICGELGPDGSFKLLLPAGSGAGFVWGSHCQCHPVGTFTFNVVAGTTTDIGDPLNQPPEANAGPDQVVEATSPQGAVVALDGGASNDPEGDALAYVWTGTFGSASGLNPVVTMPLGTNVLTLEVSDGIHTAQDQVVVEVVDTTPPSTTLTAAEADGVPLTNGGSTLSSDFLVSFTATDAVGVAGYECSLDGSAFVACASPASYTGLAVGGHTFQVRAGDATGNVDASPESFAWSVITPAQASQDLLDAISNLGLPGGTANSLSAPLGQASTLLNDGNPNNDGAACGKLDAFLNQVDAKLKSGKLTVAQGTELQQQAEAIKAALGC